MSYSSRQVQGRRHDGTLKKKYRPQGNVDFRQGREVAESEGGEYLHVRMADGHTVTVNNTAEIRRQLAKQGLSL